MFSANQTLSSRFLLLTKRLSFVVGLFDYESHTYAIYGELFGYTQFSRIPRSFGALSLGFFRILSSTYLSCLDLSILLFGFLGSFFMDSVYLNLLTMYCAVECVLLTSCPILRRE